MNAKEIEILKEKSDRLDKIEEMINSGVISIYIQPGDNFDYGNADKDAMNSCYSVAALTKFNDEHGMNALTKNPFIIEELIIANGRNQRELMERVSTKVKEKKKIDDDVNIYLMKNKRNGYIKIGLTKGKPEYREATLQSQEPEIELMFSFKSKRSTEDRLHSRFADKRLRGEWFELDDSDVDQIKSEFMQEWE
ncbi:hypothetical protein NVP1016O_26 [Vibrio phage 1.016.O._10N.286.46.A11]|nr:hypothetical protein NVP1016O_26 [Vibrio phage 1.016.O._10N.286.46.A11]